MTRRNRHIVGILVAAAYVISGILLEVAHHDVHNYLTNVQPAMSSHDCGAREIHVPPDKRHDCLACTVVTQRVTTEIQHALPPASPCTGSTLIPAISEHPLKVGFYHSGKRGPPHA
jgi:hypothetical protein